MIIIKELVVRLKEKYKKSIGSEFIRNVFLLTTGTTIAQAIPVLISPILSRIYSPDEFGVWQLWVSIAAIIGIVSTARYEMAIMLPKLKRDALNVLSLSIIIAFIVSSVTFLVLFIFNKPLSIAFGLGKIEKYLLLIPLSILMIGCYQAFNVWSSRQKTFKLNSISKIAQSSTLAGSNLLFGFLKFGSIGLILGTLLSQIVGTIVLAGGFFKNNKFFRKEISKKEIKTNFVKYNDFLKINTPHAFIDTIQENGLIFFIILFFSTDILGQYSFAFRVLKVPVTLIGSSIYLVLYQKISDAYNSGGDVRAIIKRMYLNLLLIGTPVFFILFIFSPQIFSFIFGSRWIVSGEIAQILIPWLFLNFIASPVSCIAVVANKQKEAMFITIVDITLRFSGILIGGYFHNYKLGFTINSISCSLVLLYGLRWYLKIAKPNQNLTQEANIK